MTPEQFVYWLQGFAELNGPTVPTFNQWKAIQEHLATVFKKETPKMVSPVVLPPGNREIKPTPSGKTLPELIREAERLGQGELEKAGLFPGPRSSQIIC